MLNARQFYRQGKRPTRLLLVSTVWLFGGAISLFQGQSIASSYYAIYQSSGNPQLVQSAVSAEVVLGSLLVILGVVQLAFVYGLMSQRSWCRGVVKLAASILLVYLAAASIHEWISSALYQTPFFSLPDLVLVMWALFFLGATWRYAEDKAKWDFLNIGPTKSES